MSEVLQAARLVAYTLAIALGLLIIAIGLLYILYQRVQAAREPDEVNEVTIEADGGSEER